MAAPNTTAVSVRVTIKQRSQIRKLGINPAKIFKKALNTEIRAKELEAIMKKGKHMSKIFAKLPIETVVASIREDRNSR